MVSRKSSEIASSEITPKPVYLNRRNFMKGSLALGAAALAGHNLHQCCSPRKRRSADEQAAIPEERIQHQRKADAAEGRDALQQLLRVLHRQRWPGEVGEARFSRCRGASRSRAWCRSRKTYDMDALLKLARWKSASTGMRCVEGWSMVIPWIGFPLSALIKQVEPTSEGEVRRVHHACFDPSQMPGQKRERARLAVRRGLAARRGDAPADASLRSGFTARPCPTRMARPYGWWFPGNMASRAPSPSSRSSSWTTCRRPPGTRLRPTSTASIPT